jgi:preprotein translocase subunit SecB
MVKKRKRRSPEPEPAASPSLLVSPIPFSLDRIALRSLSYTEVTTEQPVVPLPLGERMNVGLHVEMGVQILADGFELYLVVHATPDPRHLPFTIKAGISAFFTPRAEVEQQDILDFVSGAGVRILFPYVREVISTTSARGVFGPLWLDPLAIGAVDLKAAEISHPEP